MNSRRVCPHCDECLSLKTYKTHRRLYYDVVDDKWLRRDLSQNADDGSDSGVVEPCDSPPQSFGHAVASDHPSQSSDFTFQEDHVSLQSDDDADTTREFEQDEDEYFEVWLTEDEEDILDDVHPPKFGSLTTAEGESSQSRVFTQWIVAFVCYLRKIYRISDAVTGKLLLFLYTLLRALGEFSTLCRIIASTLPSSVHKLVKYTGSASALFRKYVVCRKCHHLSSINQTFRDENSRSCPFVEFPNHPHFIRRQPCGTILVKMVELVSGKKMFYPFLTYC